ncbi:MAG: TIR domain-containing protein [Fusobacteriaceae bacterium]
MARKTFISYKFSEAQELRDKIISSLGNDASYYQGETSESPDLTDLLTDSIKENLKNMIYDSSVTIVVISPNIKQSKWIDWEIEYSLKEITRANRTSKTNGVVGVIQKVNGSYDWFRNKTTDIHGKSALTYNKEKVYEIISKNHFNSKPPIWHCDRCKVYNYNEGSYISYIEEETFLENPNFYIENAYKKSENISKYELKKIR